ncbi:MAG: aspartate-semialdehyde dehydrogenase [bacterium]
MYKVAVAGATGAVGREMIRILEERDFPISELVLLASERSRGKKLSFQGRDIEVEVLADRSFEDIDIALFSAGSSIVKEHAGRIIEDGAVIVDNSSAFRYEPEIPLVVPEVNPGALDSHEGLVANPNCSTIQLVMVLAPIHEKYGIKRIVVSTYQAASGAGGSGRQELFEHTRLLTNGESIPAPKEFTRELAFNAIPQIDVFLEEDNNYTKEEMKMVWETRKILDDQIIEVSPTAVRIPVLNCHGEAVNIETHSGCAPEEVRRLLAGSPGVKVVDNPAEGEFPTMLDADGTDDTYVGRIRRDPSLKHGLNCWIVADNLRKGAALNTIQIAETLIARELV